MTLLSAPPGITTHVHGIEVEDGKLPGAFGEPLGPAGQVSADHRRAMLRQGAVGAYVEDGRRVVVQAPSPDLRLEHDYLVYAFAGREVLHQQGRFTLHATLLVSPDGRAVAITGDSGVGKSTTTAELVSRGWTFSCDDVVEVRTEGEMTAVPMARPIHLSDDAARRLGGDTSLGRDLPGRGKKVYALDGDLTPRPLTAIVRLRCQPVPETTYDVMTPLDALPALAHHSDRYGTSRSPERRAAYLAWLARIVSEVGMVTVQRPVEGDTTAEVADRVERFTAG